MAALKQIRQRNQRRALRVRGSVTKGKFPRVSVFRSLKQIYVQLIDDREGKTLASSSSISLKEKQANKVNIAHEVGKQLAQKALDQGIQQVIFDRGSFLYHGRVKAVAEGLRAGGLQV